MTAPRGDLGARLVKRELPSGGVLELVERAVPAGEFDAETRSFSVVASTETVDRYGDVIEASGWVLDAYRANPAVLVDHDYRVGSIVGRGYPVVDGKALRVKVELDPPELNPRAAQVARLIAAGSLKAVSVGFRPLAWEPLRDEKGRPTGGVRFTKSELLELSMVAVPANPAALLEPAGRAAEVRVPADDDDDDEALALLLAESIIATSAGEKP